MSATSLIDELAGLLDAMEDGPETAPSESPATRPASAALQTVATGSPASGNVTSLPGAKAKADANKAARAAMVEQAMHAAVEALQVIRRTFAENGADFDDACRALPLVHKVLEHVDRMEAAANVTASLPLLNFQIILDPNVPQEAPPGRRVKPLQPAPDVIDMDNL